MYWFSGNAALLFHFIAIWKREKTQFSDKIWKLGYLPLQILQQRKSKIPVRLIIFLNFWLRTSTLTFWLITVTSANHFGNESL